MQDDELFNEAAPSRQVQPCPSAFQVKPLRVAKVHEWCCELVLLQCKRTPACRSKSAAMSGSLRCHSGKLPQLLSPVLALPHTHKLVGFWSWGMLMMRNNSCQLPESLSRVNPKRERPLCAATAIEKK